MIFRVVMLLTSMLTVLQWHLAGGEVQPEVWLGPYPNQNVLVPEVDTQKPQLPQHNVKDEVKIPYLKEIAAYLNKGLKNAYVKPNKELIDEKEYVKPNKELIDEKEAAAEKAIGTVFLKKLIEETVKEQVMKSKINSTPPKAVEPTEPNSLMTISPEEMTTSDTRLATTEPPEPNEACVSQRVCGAIMIVVATYYFHVVAVQLRIENYVSD